MGGFSHVETLTFFHPTQIRCGARRQAKRMETYTMLFTNSAHSFFFFHSSAICHLFCFRPAARRSREASPPRFAAIAQNVTGLNPKDGRLFSPCSRHRERIGARRSMMQRRHCAFAAEQKRPAASLLAAPWPQTKTPTQAGGGGAGA